MKQAKVLNEKEQQRVFRAAAHTRNAERNTLMLMLSYYAGMRACEISSIKVSDCIDENGNTHGQVYLAAEQTKGNDAQVIYFNSKIQKAIKRYVESKRLHGSSYLFVTERGTHFSSATIQQALKNIYLDAGISNASSHSGRRSMLSKMSEMGISVAVIQRVARHKHLSTTQRYIEVSSDKLAAAVELV